MHARARIWIQRCLEIWSGVCVSFSKNQRSRPIGVENERKKKKKKKYFCAFTECSKEEVQSVLFSSLGGGLISFYRIPPCREDRATTAMSRKKRFSSSSSFSRSSASSVESMFFPRFSLYTLSWEKEREEQQSLFFFCWRRHAHASLQEVSLSILFLLRRPLLCMRTYLGVEMKE